MSIAAEVPPTLIPYIPEAAIPTQDWPAAMAALRRESCHLEVLIPAKNEASRLPGTLSRTIEYLEAQDYSSSVVVIDNGSVDQTSDLAARQWSSSVPVRLTGCAQLGKGAAVRRGFLTSRARFAGYMDADLATPIETLDIVLPLLEDGHDVVVGSRWMNGAVLARRQPVSRVLGGMAFRALAHMLIPQITDSQCGFKFFTGDLARTIFPELQINGYAFDIELLRAVIKMGIPITEVPVMWSDMNGSSVRALRDGARAFYDIARMARQRTAA